MCQCFWLFKFCFIQLLFLFVTWHNVKFVAIAKFMPSFPYCALNAINNRSARNLWFTFKPLATVMLTLTNTSDLYDWRLYVESWMPPALYPHSNVCFLFFFVFYKVVFFLIFWLSTIFVTISIGFYWIIDIFSAIKINKYSKSVESAHEHTAQRFFVHFNANTVLKVYIYIYFFVNNWV